MYIQFIPEYNMHPGSAPILKAKIEYYMRDNTVCWPRKFEHGSCTCAITPYL